MFKDLVRNTIGECISTTVKHGGRGVMVWGAFSAAGTGELLHCEKSIHSLEYRRILHKGLIPTIEKLSSKEEQSNVFQQDNAPAQTAKTTKTWLENKSIRLMFWPGQSPDLNLLEQWFPNFLQSRTPSDIQPPAAYPL